MSYCLFRAIAPCSVGRMKKGFKMIVRVLLFVIAFFVFAKVPVLKRTIPGRVCRFVLGSPLATQWSEDFVDDVRSLREPQLLRQWSQDMLDAYTSGGISTNSPAKYWSLGQIEVPGDLIPNWLPERLYDQKFGQPPDVSIRVDAAGRPLYLLYAWYLTGLIISGDDEAVVDFKPFCLLEAAPGIHAYSLEK